MQILMRDAAGREIELPPLNEDLLTWFTRQKLVLRDPKGREIEVPPLHQVHDWLRETREARGKTLNEVADACGVTRQAVWCWETAKTHPTLDNLLKLAQFLYADDADLVAEERMERVDEILEGTASPKRRRRKDGAQPSADMDAVDALLEGFGDAKPAG